MKIVPMTTEDAKELAVLDQLCFNVPWSEKSFLEETENPLATYFVAKEDEKIVGYGGIWNVSGEGQITNIAVHPEMRKKGIASKILKELISCAKSCEKIFLEVRESNLAAICLYEKHGFEKCGVRKNFYHSPVENGIIMIREEM
ncbi:MAG: ribosomal protein S18-alanine N-acetyltransferase [Clostridia bacterium]|nr:ribosomal protein S18-alanine N-acetyltransferase [Clostridia bacterium]